jgi:hypothetical protein
MWGTILEFPQETEEDHEAPHLRQPISGPGFEPGTPRIQSRNATHSTKTFNSKLGSLQKDALGSIL